MATFAPPRPNTRQSNPNASRPNPNAAPSNPNTSHSSPNNAGNNPNQHPKNLSKLDTIRLVLTSLDNNLDAFAAEATMNDLANERKKGPFFKRMARNMWHTMMRGDVVTRANAANRAKLKDAGDLRHLQGKEDAQWREDVVRRYSSDYAEHVIHHEAGETFKKFDKSEAEQDKGIKLMRDQALDAVCAYARGDIATIDDLKMTVEQLEEGWRADAETTKHIGEGIFMAHNIIAMGEQTKAALDARQGLSDIEREQLLAEAREDAEFITGEAKVGSRAEVDPTGAERLAEKMRNAKILGEGGEEGMSRIGSILGNETVISMMTSVGFFALQRGIASAASKLVPGLGAAIIVGIRERRTSMDERDLLARRVGQGETADTTIKSQAEIDATMYESRPVGELLAELAALYDANGDLNIADRDAVDKAIELQAEIRARIELSDRNKSDLINYADISSEAMEGRRFDLDLAMAKLETDLRKAFADPTESAAMGVTNVSYDALLQKATSEMSGLIKGEMKERDRLFNKLLRSRILKRAAIAVLAGAGMSALLEHGAEWVRDFFNGKKSDVEMVRTGNESPLGDPSDVPDVISGQPSEVPPFITGGPSEVPPFVTGEPSEVPPFFTGAPSEVPPFFTGSPSEVPPFIDPEVFKGGDTVVLGDKTKVVLPEGYKIEVHGDVAKMTTPQGEVFATKLEKNGTFSKEGLEALKSKGFNIVQRQDVVEGEPKVHNEKVGAREFVDRHKAEMVKIKHERWLINQEGGADQKVYNLNELGLDNKQLSNGDIRVSVQGMTAEGSFYGDDKVNWKEAAKAGQLKLYLSASPGTQSRAFEIPIDADGEIVIDKDSPAGRLFDKNGKFIGGFQQVSVKGDMTPDGRVKIATLATVVGTKHPEINDIVETPTKETAHTYVVVPPVENVNYATATEEDIFIPYITAMGRRRMGESIPAPVAPPNAQPANGPNTPNSGPNAGPTGGPSNPNSPNSGPQYPPRNAPNNGPNSSPNNGPNAAPNNANTNSANQNTSNGGPNAAPNAATNPGANPNTANPNTANAQPGNQQNTTNTSLNSGRNNGNEWKKYARTSTGASNQSSSSATGNTTGSTSNASSGNPNNTANTGQNPNTNASQSSNPNSGPRNPNNGPNVDPNSRHSFNFTAEEKAVFDKITRDRLGNEMPDVFKALKIDPNNVSSMGMRLIIISLKQIMNKTQRMPNEPYVEWRMRMVQTAHAYSERALANIGTVSGGLRSFVREAFENLRDATTPVSASTQGAGATANATTGATASAGAGTTTP